MILKLIDNKSNTATGAVNYVLGSLNHKGEKRPFEPVILRGDPQLTKEIDKTFCEKFQRKASSFVIAFAPDEQPTVEQMNEIIDNLEKIFFGNMRGRTNSLYVLHEEIDDQGRKTKHIHGVTNRVDLESGKSFNPFPPPPKEKQLLENDSKYERENLFERITNSIYGWEQVVTKDPLKIEGETKLLDKLSGMKNLKTREEFDKYFHDLVRNGVIKNRDELLKHIKKDGYELARLGQDYISIKNKEGKSVRLKGGIYEKNDDKDYSVKIEEHHKKNDEIKKSCKEPATLIKKIERLNKLIEYRNTYNNKRYSAPEKSQPVFSRELKQQREIEQQAQAKTVSHAPNAVATHTPSTSATRTAGVDTVATRIQAIRAVAGHEPTQSPTLSSGGGTGGGGGDIDGQINEAMSAVNNARTPAEKANAMARLKQLLEQKARMAQKMKNG